MPSEQRGGFRAAEDGASEEEETEAEAGFIKRTAYDSIPMQLHYTTHLSHSFSRLVLPPASPSPPFILSSPHFIFILGCFWESVHSLLSLVSRWFTNVWVIFSFWIILWNKKLPRCIFFLKSFCICDMHPLYLFFFNFLIFCWIKNHRFVRRKILSFWFLSNLCGSNLMLSFFSGRNI